MFFHLKLKPQPVQFACKEPILILIFRLLNDEENILRNEEGNSNSGNVVTNGMILV